MKPFLTIIACGKSSEHLNWKENYSLHGFDLALLQYDEFEYTDDNSLRAEYFIQKPGMKYTLINNFYRDFPEALNYEYTLMMDDDISTSPLEIEKFFRTSKEYKFDLCQPGLSRNSYFTYESTRKIENAIYHLTPMVETMTPCFSKNIIGTAVADLSLTKTGFGWGFEALWEKQFHQGNGHSRFGGLIGVIDNVDFGHYRKVMGNESGIYKKFGSPIPDMNSLLWRFGLQWHGGSEFVTFEVKNEL